MNLLIDAHRLFLLLHNRPGVPFVLPEIQAQRLRQLARRAESVEALQEVGLTVVRPAGTERLKQRRAEVLDRVRRGRRPRGGDGRGEQGGKKQGGRPRFRKRRHEGNPLEGDGCLSSAS